MTLPAPFMEKSFRSQPLFHYEDRSRESGEQSAVNDQLQEVVSLGSSSSSADPVPVHAPTFGSLLGARRRPASTHATAACLRRRRPVSQRGSGADAIRRATPARRGRARAPRRPHGTPIGPRARGGVSRRSHAPLPSPRFGEGQRE